MNRCLQYNINMITVLFILSLHSINITVVRCKMERVFDWLNFLVSPENSEPPYDQSKFTFDRKERESEIEGKREGEIRESESSRLLPLDSVGP